MRCSRILLLLAAGIAFPLAAQEEESPELSFLEYLGSWEESDEDWQVVNLLEEEGADEDDSEADEQDDDADESDED